MTKPFKDTLTFQIPIRLINDWSKTVRVLEHSIGLVQAGKYTRDYKYSNYGHHYEIGSTGTVSHVTNGSNYWYAVAGPVVESTLPWLTQFKEDLQDLKPTFATINKLIGHGAEHRDQVDQLTGFNYFFETSDSITYVKSLEYEEQYPSIADTGWILDIQQPHRIANTGTRIWFNMRFGKPFAYCRDWFKDYRATVYE